MAPNEKLAALTAAGVSIWLDDLSRERLTTGNLASLIADQHVVGVTTNPTIFAARAGERRRLRRAGPRAGRPRRRRSTTPSARSPPTTSATPATCSAGMYDATGGVDGRVSIEVDPRLAHDTDATIAQASDLWKVVDRPNLLVKIPATEAGLPAITQDARRGHQRERHADLLRRALPRGHGRLPRRAGAGRGQRPRPGAASRRWRASSSPASTPRSTSGWRRSAPTRRWRCAARPGVANARLAYAAFQEVFPGERWDGAGRAGRQARSGRCGPPPA